jgi:DNA-directed RNA polymerase specialized sigma54-like protein
MATSHGLREGEVCDAAEAVIGNLDQDGRLNATNEENQRRKGWLADGIVERARQLVMRLGPVGCGAPLMFAKPCLGASLKARWRSERFGDTA